MLLKEYDDDLQPYAIELNYTSFWIHLYGLPLKGMTGDFVQSAGAALGVVEDIDIPEYNLG